MSVNYECTVIMKVQKIFYLYFTVPILFIYLLSDLSNVPVMATFDNI